MTRCIKITEEVFIMPTYISLMKLTEQGIKDIKGAPSRIEAASKGIEALGGKLIEVYAVMGEYDYVTCPHSLYHL